MNHMLCTIHCSYAHESFYHVVAAHFKWHSLLHQRTLPGSISVQHSYNAHVQFTKWRICACATWPRGALWSPCGANILANSVRQVAEGQGWAQTLHTCTYAYLLSTTHTHSPPHTHPPPKHTPPPPHSRTGTEVLNCQKNGVTVIICIVWRRR